MHHSELLPLDVALSPTEGTIVFDDVTALTTYLRRNGTALWAPAPGSAVMFAPPETVSESDYSIRCWQASDADGFGLYVAEPKRASQQSVEDDAGLVAKPGPLVTRRLFDELNRLIWIEQSDLRRQSTRQIERCFVFVDVSDFSKLSSGLQMLVVLALVQLANASHRFEKHEAALCIGDGYIYVFRGAVDATIFAADLAHRVEEAIAAEPVVSGWRPPEFHFRIGVHAGMVRSFWDPGRKDWNYVGDGINGGQRVLSAIGKDVDDVVFVSAEVRQRFLGGERTLLRHLDNKGRRADKHGRAWRVYQLNHSAVAAEVALESSK